MRDDIHRNAPIPRVFRRWMASCLSDAAAAVDGRLLAERACRFVIDKQVGSQGIETLRKVATQGDADLFGRSPFAEDCRQNRTIEVATRLALEAVEVGVACELAVTQAVRERMQSYCSEMVAHVMSDHSATALEANAFNIRLQEAFSQISVEGLVNDYFCGRKWAPLPSRSSPLPTGQRL